MYLPPYLPMHVYLFVYVHTNVYILLHITYVSLLSVCLLNLSIYLPTCPSIHLAWSSCDYCEKTKATSLYFSPPSYSHPPPSLEFSLFCFTTSAWTAVLSTADVSDQFRVGEGQDPLKGSEKPLGFHFVGIMAHVHVHAYFWGEKIFQRSCGSQRVRNLQRKAA